MAPSKDGVDIHLSWALVWRLWPLLGLFFFAGGGGGSMLTNYFGGNGAVTPVRVERLEDLTATLKEDAQKREVALAEFRSEIKGLKKQNDRIERQLDRLIDLSSGQRFSSNRAARK